MTAPDPRAIADAVTACPSVVALSPGPTGTVATYRPGERIVGVRVTETRVTIHVVGRWDTPIPTLVDEIHEGVRLLVDGREIDIVVEDLSEPAAIKPRTSIAKS